MVNIIDDTLELSPTTGDGLKIMRSNIGGVCQMDPFGAFSNIAFFDSADTLSLGATQQTAARIHNIFCGPVNLTKRHIFEDFNANLGAALPPEWSLGAVGHGYSIAYKKPSRLLLTTAALSAGDGCIVTMNNISLQTDARTFLYFCLNMQQSRNVDLQFGLREPVGMLDALRFRYAAGSGASSTLVCTAEKGLSATNVTTTWNAITGRRLFCLEVPRTPTDPINFYAGDVNNVLQNIASIARTDPNIPAAASQLSPFVQLRTNDAAGAIVLEWDSVYLITEW